MKTLLLFVALLCGYANAGEALRVVNSPITAALNVIKAPGDCIVPCAVMFDATNTTATTTANPIHDIQYTWNFGDSAAGSWTAGTGANPSKNAAYGPVAAHVFETAGTYNVCATYFDGTNTVNSVCAVVTAVAWNDATHGPTVCVASAAIPVAGVDGCPAGATGIQYSSFNDAIIAAITPAVNARRVLFKTNDSFSLTNSTTMSINGPGIIGAYGTGAKPVITAGGINRRFFNFTTNAGNWRIKDLEFNGNYPASSQTRVFGSLTPVNDITIINTRSYNVNTHLTFAYSLTFSTSEHRRVFVVNNEWSDTGGSGGNTVFYDGYNLAVMGNNFTNSVSAGEHIIRTQLCNTCVINNNTTSGPASTKNNITLRGRATVQVAATTTNGSPVLTSVAMPQYLYVGIRAEGTNIPANSTVTAFDYNLSTITISNNATGSGAITLELGAWTGIYTEKAVISDNYIVGSTDWPMSICPQNSTNDERSRNIIIERNWTDLVTTASIAHRVCAGYASIRNNLITTNTLSYSGISLSAEPAQPVANTAWLYNNTLYSAAGGGSTLRIYAAGSVGYENVTMKNNLAYGAGVTGDTYNGTPGSGFVESNNSSDLQIGGTSPLFVGPLTTPAGFTPGPGSYAINGGASVPLWADFYMQTRTGTYDMGALNP